ncbi:MAG: glycosyltransferase family 2 protein [Myxococcota bacterium]
MSLSGLLTIVIPTKNEERNLARCLESIPDGIETHVVDSCSTDRTRELARDAGAHVTSFDWNGRFPKKRNWFLEQGLVRTPWVLFLDADERLTVDFVAELEATLPDSKHVGYWIRYSDRFMGVPLNHGIPMRKLALFKPTSGRYERIDDARWTQLDMEVHEHPVLDGSVGELKQRVLHFDENPLEKWIARHNDYSTWEARRFVSGEVSAKTLRQRIKYRALTSRTFPAAYFCAQYFAYAGFLDGRAGLKFAAAKAIYFATVRQKIEELRRAEGRRTKSKLP